MDRVIGGFSSLGMKAGLSRCGPALSMETRNGSVSSRDGYPLWKSRGGERRKPIRGTARQAETAGLQAGTARRRRAELRNAVLRRWPATAGPPASCCENAAATSPTVRMGLSARIANGAMVRTAWNADLRPVLPVEAGTRGSAKPGPMTRRQASVSAAPFSSPAGCASGPIMRVSSGGDLQAGTAARRAANGVQPPCADRPPAGDTAHLEPS